MLSGSGFLKVFFADMRLKRGKRLCKSLIIKVFQRSRGLNFTNGTWNKVLGGVGGSVSPCYIYILYYYYYYREGEKRLCSSVPAILRSLG